MKTLIVKADTVVEPASTRWALASLSLAMLLSSLGTSIANVGLPTLAQAFNASFQDVQWVVLSYLVAITTLIVSVGRLGDVIGRRRLLLSGITLFTGASLLSAAAPSLVLLIAARAVQGLGAAVMMALTMAFVGDIVAKSRTGSVMGLLGTMSATGTALGPALGGSLIAACGWPDAGAGQDGRNATRYTASAVRTSASGQPSGDAPFASRASRVRTACRRWSSRQPPRRCCTHSKREPNHEHQISHHFARIRWPSGATRS